MRNRRLHLLHQLHQIEDADRRRARELAHGDPFLTELMLDAWRFGLSVHRYLAEMVRPRNPAPYGRRIRRLGFSDEFLYLHALPSARPAHPTRAPAADLALPAPLVSRRRRLVAAGVLRSPAWAKVPRRRPPVRRGRRTPWAPGRPHVAPAGVQP